MSTTSSQDFSRKALASAVATAMLPAAAYGAAGRVDFAYGDVKGVDPAGKERRLGKGAEINQGDTIVTARGRAQIRFSDGARTSLLPNSEFRVDTYEFEEQAPEEATGFFSLLKGGLRTITGAIGKLRRDAYQVTTPVATIGIRGTEYLVVLGNSAEIWVGDGSIEACNNGGCTTLEGGESGYVANQDTKTIHTDGKPDTSAGEGDGNEYSAAEDVDGNGTSTLLGSNNFQSGAFYTLAVSIGDNFEGTAVDQAGLPPSGLVNGTFSDGVRLTRYSGPLNGNVGSARVVQAAGDGIVGWGRWASGAITTDVYGSSTSVTLSGPESHHYAIGLPTTNMPVSGTGSYALLGGTSPTRDYPGGSTGTLNSGSLNVDFGTRVVDVHIGFTIDGTSFAIESIASPMGMGAARHTFSHSGSFTSSSACSGGCSTTLEGFFAGAGAARAGVVYKVDDESDESFINGSAGFTKTGSGSPIDL